MHSPYVGNEVDTLTLTSGDTVTVRRRLNMGEHRAYLRRGRVESADGTMQVDTLLAGLSLVVAYLLNWTLKYPDGSPIAICQPNGAPHAIEEITAAVDSIDPVWFVEIKQAIEAHQEKQTAAREQEKNGPDGGTTAPGTLPSLSALAGPSSPSAP